MPTSTRHVLLALEELGLRGGGASGFETALTAAMAEAGAALPEVHASPAAWAKRLRLLLGDRAASEWAPAVRGVGASEMLLAAALTEGDTAALRIFEATLMPEVDRAVRRLALSPDELVELRQRVRVKILVPEPPQPARIEQFRGRGSLAGWVRTVATRVALNERRDARPHDPIEELEILVPAARRVRPKTPQQHAELTGLLRAAFRELSQRDRVLLRFRYLDGMRAAALAKVYGVHESTMSRWLAGARDGLQHTFASKARAQLQDRDRVEELLSVIKSRLEWTLQGVFDSSVDVSADGGVNG